MSRRLVSGFSQATPISTLPRGLYLKPKAPVTMSLSLTIYCRIAIMYKIWQKRASSRQHCSRHIWNMPTLLQTTTKCRGLTAWNVQCTCKIQQRRRHYWPLETGARKQNTHTHERACLYFGKHHGGPKTERRMRIMVAWTTRLLLTLDVHNSSGVYYWLAS